MEIVYHIGAHGTDDGWIVRALLKNRGTLEAMGVAVPAPKLYRQVLPKVAKSLKSGQVVDDAQHVLLDAVLDVENAQRVIFSHDSLVCFPANVISEHGFYAMAPQRIEAYSNLFPAASKEFYLALVNPATLIPSLIDIPAGGTYERIMGQTRPTEIRWSSTIRRILAYHPDVNLTVWCHEDVPLIWPEILRALAGLGAEDALEGDFDVLTALLTEEGMTKFKTYLEAHPPRTLAQRRRITTAFLEKFAKPEELVAELDLPGWSEELLAQVTSNYENDCAEIAAMAGVTFIQP